MYFLCKGQCEAVRKPFGVSMGYCGTWVACVEEGDLQRFVGPFLSVAWGCRGATPFLILKIGDVCP